MKVLKNLLISGFIATFGIASVQAEITIADASQFQRPDDGTSRVRSTDIYIVQLKGDPAIAYAGDIAGYAATRPGQGQKLASSSAAVKKYTGRLMTIQNDVMASVGAEKVYNYVYTFNGFAARMNGSVVAELRKRSDVMNVWKSEIHQLSTDTSPAYIGVSGSGGAWRKGYTGENIVVGVIDSGIWPENPSFADVSTPILGDYGPRLYLDGMPSGFTPSGCDFGNTSANPSDAAFDCSRKLVTARCYNLDWSTASDANNPCGGNGVFTSANEFQSARGRDGHGSHTAATAAGNYGVRARIDGERVGKVSGIAPRARIASYKVCWDGPNDAAQDDGCGTTDILAAIDQAIADGVDVINYSVGSSSIFFDASDVAYLYAADAGIFVATSNGNSGPASQTTGTPAGVPWITAVGATQDDGVSYSAITVNAPAGVAGDYVSVEGAGDVSLADTGIVTADVLLVDDGVGVASDGCTALNNDLTGKIALVIRGVCSFSTKYNTAAAAGAVAIIVYNDGTSASRFDPFVMSAPGTTIPGFMIGYDDGTTLANATGVNATMDPDNAVSAANRIAGFSSRGPNGGMPDIIKPDVSAPGVSILAATSPVEAQPPSNGNNFGLKSGTSMASPHAAGAFALLKQKHPTWSAAQAKSALMTTARDNLLKTFGDEAADPFDIGSGEIVPTTALDPGLTFDTEFLAYVAALCGEPNQAALVGASTCSALESVGYSLDPSDLNLASIGISELVGSQTVTRTVTSVEKRKWYNSVKTYKAVVDAPVGIEVQLSDWELTLKGGESATYQVTFTATRKAVLNEWAFGSITWVEEGGDTEVRSTFAVRPVMFSYAFEVDALHGSGSIEIPIQFGYSGSYSASVSGIQPSYPIADQTVTENGSNAYCLDFGPDAMTYLRFATFDDETADPGNDDIDLDVYTLVGGDCDSNDAFLGSRFRALGPTAEESVSIYNPTARYWVVFVDGFSASNGTDIDYTLWLQPVWGDNGNTSVDAPSTATLGASDTVTVDYSGLPVGRALGVLHHEDGDGEIGLTVLDVDAR